MKKFMSIMLALALTIGVASITVAQDAPKQDDTKKSGKKGKNKKAKETTKSDGKGDTKGKTKGKKGKDGDAPPAK